MKLNKQHKVENESIVLVPYCKKHVEKYHKWMQSPELQELTASVPLTLEEEYEMQLSWYLDEDKCTFIILDKQTFDFTHDEVASMIGDTNLFIKGNGLAEIELMIAEESFRSKKRGWNAIISMLRYGVEILGLKSFFSKVGISNSPSISLFKKLKFSLEGGADVFEEFTFKVIVCEEWKKWLENQSPDYKLLLYSQSDSEL